MAANSKKLGIFPTIPDVFVNKNVKTVDAEYGVLSYAELEAEIQSWSSETCVALELVNFKRVNLDTGRDYLGMAMSTLIKSHHISWLELGPEFLASSINLATLAHMSALRTLILNVNVWSKVNFQSLQRLLSDPDCKIENLWIKGGMTVKYRDVLKEVLQESAALRHYRGPYAVTMQAALESRQLEQPAQAVAP